jgi:AcrR family transcriptional regulator
MLGSAVATIEPTATEGLRERKKRLTRKAIFDVAARLFSERGFENVTVAEIADAANISVKTLFTYVRSKEELVFSDDPNILEALVAAVRDRAPGQPPLDAVADTLLAALDDDSDRTGLEGFHRMIGQSPAIRSRIRALWDETEDALTAALAEPGDGPRERAGHRLTAAQLMVLVRTVTSQEVRASVAQAADGDTAAERQALRDWIRQAAGRLAQGLQTAGRLLADNSFRVDDPPNREGAAPFRLTRERAQFPRDR